MATHSSIHARKILWTEEPGAEEPGGLQPVGSQSRTRLSDLRSAQLSSAQWVVQQHSCYWLVSDTALL